MDFSEGKEVQRFKEPSGQLTCLALTKDGHLVMTGNAEGTVRVWDTETGKEKLSFQTGSGTINGMALSPDDQYVLTGGTDGVARLWTHATANAIDDSRGTLEA